ncbi:endospore germination permease [Paenibacillus filicis]|uniref:Endospore germination permease n=1 Tax=Paenibacillus gyeongsangnamensis TaxID=3388067 RepID=A0ABT4QLJ6_9BACL|nr:endospore germination permease [Paenibacillus filicis]MCZ8517715.1 endospore germination permease [Paenibacillus filicis]
MTVSNKISYKQLVYLMILSRIVITLTYLPGLTSPPKNRDFWIAELLNFPFHILFAIPLYLLWRRYPEQSIIEYSQTLLGKLGKGIGFLYIWFFLHFAAITLSQFDLFLTTMVMPETPILFFAASLTLFCAYAVRKDIEVIGRLSELIAPLIMVTVITILLLLFNEMRLEELSPVLESGLMPVLYNGFTSAARTTEIIGMTMILPFLNDRKKAERAILVSMIFISIFFVLITIPVLTVYGIEHAKRLSFPFFQVVKMISIGNFLEHLESIHVGVWVLGVFVKISFYYYMAVLGLKQMFNFKDYKTFVLPMGTILVPLSIMISPSVVELKEFTGYKTLTWYALFYMVVIPGILLIVSSFRKKEGIRL